ncbi:sugar ABC transporter ATP-binding protein [Paenibacillus abyssi]|uniref:Monosaccharide-transporting ATPase n=1 Tax=Paenibacillus abyssi TaxID=1340531 RepID=A0A917FSD5_9BACL|nr:sugar ABC transporter ATP-binding protein [Paenibacillus abyssi]GGG04009.1 monosaccharide-transporting ATPase [Paenibacillus abyssi]
MGEMLLEAVDIYKSYSGVSVLRNVQLHIRRGEVHALMGENGAGKSTLMKILTGVVKQDSGQVRYKGQPLRIQHPKEIQRLGIGIVYQEFNLLPDLTVAQNIFIGREPGARLRGFISERQLNEDAAKILQQLKLKINPRMKVSELSVAEQQMVEIAKTLSYNCELLILDEPTAALTESEIDTLFDVIHDLKAQGVAIIYISHRMNELKRIVDRVTVLRDGQYISEHLFQDTTVDKLIQEMVGRELTSKFPGKPDYSRGKKTLEVKNVSTKQLLRNISFEAYEGEILGIAGLMGAGRTELARAIFGADRMVTGEIWIQGKKVAIQTPAEGIRHGIGYITEDRKKDGLMLSINIKDNIMISNYDKYSTAGWVKENEAKRVTDHYITRLGIKAVNRNQEVGNLSGGNQQKVVLAKWLCRHTNILIFDEPTRGIDVGAKYEVYELMYELVLNGVTVIMISSELPEILGMSDRILVMAEGRITADLSAEDADQEKITHYAMNQ